VAGEPYSAWLIDLGVNEARLRGATGLPPGSTGDLVIDDVGAVSARVVRETNDGCVVALDPAPLQRQLLLRKLHTGDFAPGTVRGDLKLIVKALARALWAR
jgi:hypothetical protein